MEAEESKAAQKDQEMMVDTNNNLEDVEHLLMDVDQGNSAANGEEADKENNAAIVNALNANSQDLLDQVEKQDIVVTDKKTKQVVSLETGQEAYYALLAQDMLAIA